MAGRRCMMAWTALWLLAGCGAGGGGGGGGNTTPTKTLSVVPSAFSAEQSQVVAITASVINISAPNYTYVVNPPTALQAAGTTAATVADQFGAVDTSGNFTAGADAVVGSTGSVTVTETTSGLHVQIPIVIVPFVNNITISPTTANVVAGQTATFTATGYDINSQPIAGAQVDYRVTGGIGTVTSAGLFTATTAGSGTVTAAIGGAQAAVAQITVVGTVSGLSIQPSGNPISIEAGTTRLFTAVVTDNAGHTATVAATWSADSAIGTISSGGTLTAANTPTATGNIKAVYKTQTATLPVLIVPQIKPPVGGPYNVTGVVSTSAGAPAAGVTVTVTASGATTPSGTFVTSTGGDGLLPAGTYIFWLPPGSYTIAATSGASTASGTVTLASADQVFTVNLKLSP